MRTAALFSLFLLAGAQPLEQSLTVDPVKYCSELPDYSPQTKIAGPWTINVDGCYNGTSSHSCSIEGFSTSADITRQFGDEGYLNGLVSSIIPSSQPTTTTASKFDTHTDHNNKPKRKHKNSTSLQRQRRHISNRSTYSLWLRRSSLATRRHQPPPSHRPTRLGSGLRARAGLPALDAGCTAQGTLPWLEWSDAVGCSFVGAGCKHC